jgi:nitroreductase/NAD-dependent dihydropyrimidine dehydrogenase PreA subunit
VNSGFLFSYIDDYMKIEINKDKCRVCGACEAICPSRVFKREDGKMTVHHRHACIDCGHCVAVCHDDAIEHSSFPASKVHEINKEILPTADAVLELCRSRRSNRAFSTRSVPREMIDAILEAAHTAPTASNAQGVEYTVVTSQEHLEFIRRHTIKGYEKMYRMLSMPVVKQLIKIFAPKTYSMRKKIKRVIKEDRKGRDIVLRGATAVILIHTPRDSRFGRDDANLAYQNASLMAESLGVSQFYGGFICSVVRRDKKQIFEKHFGIDGAVQSVMALGMPAIKFHSYIDRKELKVKSF